MRVNIAYSVDIDSIPKEVCSLLPKGYDSVWLSKIIDNLENDNIDVAIQSIDSLRKEMFEVDQRLADCSAILQGYIKSKYMPQSDLEQIQNMIQENEGTVQDDSAS